MTPPPSAPAMVNLTDDGSSGLSTPSAASPRIASAEAPGRPAARAKSREPPEPSSPEAHAGSKPESPRFASTEAPGRPGELSYCHVPKGKQSQSSKRVHEAAAKLSAHKSRPSRMAMRRAAHKEAKQASMLHLAPQGAGMVEKALLEEKTVYFLGGEGDKYRHLFGQLKSVFSLQIVDARQGAIVRGQHRNIEFLLVPRQSVLAVYQRSVLSPQLLCSVFRDVLKGGTSLHRGQRITIDFEQDSAFQKYKCIGQQPNRGAPGLRDTANVSNHDWNILRALVSRSNDAVDAWVDTLDSGGMRAASKNAVFSGMEHRRENNGVRKRKRGQRKKGGTAMGAVAVGCNVVLNSHTDEDFYYSMVSTHIDTHEYVLDMPIVCTGHANRPVLHVPNPGIRCCAETWGCSCIQCTHTSLRLDQVDSG